MLGGRSTPAHSEPSLAPFPGQLSARDRPCTVMHLARSRRSEKGPVDTNVLVEGGCTQPPGGALGPPLASLPKDAQSPGWTWHDERVNWSPASPVVRRFVRAPVALYRWRLGWLLGHRFILLVHVGRRSGIERRTVLEVVHYDPKTSAVVVMSGFGRTSDWYRNIQVQPAREVVIARRSFVPMHRDLTESEAVAAVADYERRNRIAAPIIRSVLSKLVGWRYDGTEEARRRLVRERPLVLFTPRS